MSSPEFSSREAIAQRLESVEAELYQHQEALDFSAFGDNALQFSLLYWFDASRTAREPLASDLRFMIDKAFAEAGIVIAFPQHDIHLNDSKPRASSCRARPGTPAKNPPPANAGGSEDALYSLPAFIDQCGPELRRSWVGQVIP